MPHSHAICRNTRATASDGMAVSLEHTFLADLRSYERHAGGHAAHTVRQSRALCSQGKHLITVRRGRHLHTSIYA